MATRTINPDELRNRFRAAQRMPQSLEERELVRGSQQWRGDWSRAAVAPMTTV